MELSQEQRNPGRKSEHSGEYRDSNEIQLGSFVVANVSISGQLEMRT